MRISSLTVLLTTALLAPAALAETHEVKMLTRSPTAGMVYDPDYLQIAPGDTVKFVATQSGHNAATLPAIWPEGVPTFMGKIDQEIEQTFTVPGLYGIQCTPHLAMGMVMLIQVGEPPAEAPALPASLPKRALDRMNAALARQAAP
ncbi:MULTISPECIES: pseudoazurin [unclassified Pseudomonas]|uniref:pseudoazurin n=1 Tax=unclassified Pseudomonas TaxID=196821 RepID=UPI001295AFB4|nr:MULTISPECIES: pseudoazurin [unclassified Pseudomonas]MQT39425.1 pseudoazurin [Pseudomonas sp. FSL R10-0765]MQT50456.1 pseudoazurin [Pseudomonas sp. FSL R10-2398]MQU02543.1 pseudoazurin [Pseudomonas sp. FSL R10-2245]MQU13148.1 pseudoazurin [Pseudomonas sp. FSL R10-2189]MQU37693.1 pseudoazurin [Pseudomonas sp. FSL R10-2172]